MYIYRHIVVIERSDWMKGENTNVYIISLLVQTADIQKGEVGRICTV